jgi:prephenate dehydratase
VLRVAYQGAPGAFSESALAALWPSADRVPLRDFADVVRAVAEGRVDAGILPIENSCVAAVAPACEALLAAPDVHVIAETTRAIDHCVVAPRGATLERLRSIESHPVALAQCSVFTRGQPHVDVRITFDTAGAARDVAAAADPTRGAIASRDAATLYGLDVLASGVQDFAGNRTRFVGIARSAASVAEAAPAKTTLSVPVPFPEDARGAAIRLALATVTSLAAETKHLTTAATAAIFDVVHAAGDRTFDAALAPFRSTLGCRVLGTYPATVPLSPADWGLAA